VLTIFLTSIKKGIMKLDIQKFIKLNEFLPGPISNLFQKGKKMKSAKTLFLLVISLMLALSSCLNPQNEEQSSSEGPVVLEIDLGGNSRAERFLGTFDQINRLALDIVRNYGNKTILVDEKLTRDNSTGKWVGSIDNLIVGFDYTITAHAYRTYVDPSDNFTYEFKDSETNKSYVEIFTGTAEHTVSTGTNTLNIRLSPILDSRTLSIPTITHIYRPFQMINSTTDNITVKVDTVSKSNSSAKDDDLSYRFRAVDNNSMPIDNVSIGGSFSSNGSGFSPTLVGTLNHIGSGVYNDVKVTYQAPGDNSSCFNTSDVQGQCPQKLQVRVSNLQEIGVTAHFTIYITDDTSIESPDSNDNDTQNIVDTNPTPYELTGERKGEHQVKFSVPVSNDDGFAGLSFKWEYIDSTGGSSRTFSGQDMIADGSDSSLGTMVAYLDGYQDTDDGMLLLTVCEDLTYYGYSSCEYGNDASTTISLSLIAGMFKKPIVCENENSCASEFDNSWIACDTNNGSYGSLNFAARRLSMDIGSGKATRTEEFTNDPTCVDNASVQITHIIEGVWDAEDNITMVKYSYDNASMVEAKKGTLTIDSFNLRIDNISLLGVLGSKICGHEYWTGVTNDVTGCDDGNFEFFDNGTVMKGIARVENDVFRWNMHDNTSSQYPDALNCNQFGLESNGNYMFPISNSSSCKDDKHSSSHSDVWVPFNSLVTSELGVLDLNWSSQSDNYRLSGSYATNCMVTNGSGWGTAQNPAVAGQDYPVGMQSHRVATVITSNESISSEYYYFSNDNCSYDNLISAEIRSYNNVSRDSDNNSLIVMKGENVQAKLIAGDQAGADYFNHIWNGSFGQNLDNMSANDNYTITQSGSFYNLWIPYDNDSFKEAWWHDNASEFAQWNWGRCLFKDGKGNCSHSY